MRQYIKVLALHKKKAFEIQQKCLSLDHSDLVHSHHTIGQLYYDMGDRPRSTFVFRNIT